MEGLILFLVVWVVGAPLAALLLAQRARRRSEEVERRTALELRALRSRVERLEGEAGVAPPVRHAAPAPPPLPPAVVPAEAPPCPPAEVAPTPPVPGRVRPPPVPSVAPVAARAAVPVAERRKTSLEARIGGQWFNWIGILALLFGVSYLLKYAFDQGWISPAAQFAGGVALGLGLLAWGERSERRGYPILARGFWGGGIGILFLDLFAGFRFHGILSQPAAFAGMAVTTAGAAALAVARRSATVAVLAAIGGYLTPLLLSTGEANQAFLFTHLAILTAGLLAMDLLRGWRFLHPVAFAAVGGWFGAWWATEFARGDHALTLLFLAVFFGLFATAPVLALRRPPPPAAHLPGALLAPGLCAVGGIAALRLWAPAGQGAFLLGEAAALLGLARAARAGGSVGATLRLAFANGAALLLLVAAWREPTLGEHRTTMAWALLSLAFLAAEPVAGAPTRWWGLGTLFLAAARLLVVDVPDRLLDPEPWRPVLGVRGVAFGAVFLAALGAWRRYRRGPAARESVEARAALLAEVVALALPAAWVTLELRSAWNAWAAPAFASPDRAAQGLDLWTTLAWAAYGSAVLLVAHRRGERFLRGIACAAVAAALWKLLLRDLHPRVGPPFEHLLANPRFAVLAAVAGLLALDARVLRRPPAPWPPVAAAATVAAHALVPVALGTEWWRWAGDAEGAAPGWADLPAFGLAAILAVHAGLLLAWAARRPAAATSRWTAAGLLAAAALLWLQRSVGSSYETYAHAVGNPRALSGALLAAACFVGARAVRGTPWEARGRPAADLGGHAVVVLLLTFETGDRFAAGVGGLPAWIEPGDARQLAFSLLWAVYAVGLVVAGFVRRWRPIRLAGLAFLMVTVLKVFLLDLSFLENPYRILSFVGLGAVLVGVSFLYQRWKDRLFA